MLPGFGWTVHSTTAPAWEPLGLKNVRKLLAWRVLDISCKINPRSFLQSSPIKRLKWRPVTSCTGNNSGSASTTWKESMVPLLFTTKEYRVIYWYLQTIQVSTYVPFFKRLKINMIQSGRTKVILFFRLISLNGNFPVPQEGQKSPKKPNKRSLIIPILLEWLSLFNARTRSGS